MDVQKQNEMKRDYLLNAMTKEGYPQDYFTDKNKLHGAGKASNPMSYYFSEEDITQQATREPFLSQQNEAFGGLLGNINREKSAKFGIGINQQQFSSKQGDSEGRYPSSLYGGRGMNKINMSNINNMNINIINQLPIKTNLSIPQPQENEEFINTFNKLSIGNDQSTSTPGSKKDLAYNYYFGAGQNQMQQGADQCDDEEEVYSPGLGVHDYQGQGKGFAMSQSQGNQFNQIHPGLKQQSYNYTSTQGDFYPKNLKRGLEKFDEEDVRTNPNPRTNINQLYQNQNFENPYQAMMMNPNEKMYQQKKSNFNKKNEQRLQQEHFLRSTGYTSTQSNIPGRFFVIKSVDEDNVHKSVKYRIWCSTIKGNQKLQKAFKEADNKYPIYLFFSVNGSGRFLGLAQMISDVEYRANFNYWSQMEKWKGFFFVAWITIKDIPNRVFRNIINEYNENKPVTSSRDTQEIHPLAGAEMLKIFNDYPYESSILDDFTFFEKRQDIVTQPTKKSHQNYQNAYPDFFPKGMDMNMNNMNMTNMNMNNMNTTNMNSSNIRKNQKMTGGPLGMNPFNNPEANINQGQFKLMNSNIYNPPNSQFMYMQNINTTTNPLEGSSKIKIDEAEAGMMVGKRILKKTHSSGNLVQKQQEEPQIKKEMYGIGSDIFNSEEHENENENENDYHDSDEDDDN